MEHYLDCEGLKRLSCDEKKIDKLLDIDFKRRALIQEVETLKADRNSINHKISLKYNEISLYFMKNHTNA